MNKDSNLSIDRASLKGFQDYLTANRITLTPRTPTDDED
jgi:hypothetical protein